MTKSSIATLYQQSPQFGKLQETISQVQDSNAIENPSIGLKGLAGSALSFVLADTFDKQERPFLAIFNDKEEAAYFHNDLQSFLQPKEVLFFPTSYKRPYEFDEIENANVLQRRS